MTAPALATRVRPHPEHWTGAFTATDPAQPLAASIDGTGTVKVLVEYRLDPYALTAMLYNLLDSPADLADYPSLDAVISALLPSALHPGMNEIRAAEILMHQQVTAPVAPDPAALAWHGQCAAHAARLLSPATAGSKPADNSSAVA